MPPSSGSFSEVHLANCLPINVCLKYGLMMAMTKLRRLSCCGCFAMLHSGVGSVPAVNWWKAGFNSVGTAVQ